MNRFFLTLTMFAIMTSITKAQDTSRVVEITTSYGSLEILLYDNTPLHRDNFIQLVSEGFYDGTLFHRVINNFMIQGGDPDSKNAKSGQMLGIGGPGYTIPAEFVPENIHKKGALAAARMGDDTNPNKESSGSQFYIVQGRPFSENELNQMELRSGSKYSVEHREIYKTVGGTPHLDGNYTVFGEVISGLDVVDAIARTKTAKGDRPATDISMTIKIIR